MKKKTSSSVFNLKIRAQFTKPNTRTNYREARAIILRMFAMHVINQGGSLTPHMVL